MQTSKVKKLKSSVYPYSRKTVKKKKKNKEKKQTKRNKICVVF